MIYLAALVDYRRWYIRNGDKPLCPGDTFGKIAVEDIHATGKFLDELPPNWTAVVTLSGEGVDDLQRDMILG